MITIKTPEEIAILKEGGKILAKVLKAVKKKVKPGVSTQELNDLAEKLIKKNKAKPSFKNYGGYPASLCVSVNNEVVHGIPSKFFLKKGDIVGLDLGLEYQGYFTDTAVTVGVGRIGKLAKKLIRVTEKSLEIGIKQIKPDNFIGDIGFAVQRYVEGRGFSVVRDLAGHGVGYKVHEEPMIPNFGRPKTGPVIKPGMVLAVEPMVNAGGWPVKTLNDGWTIVTADGSLSAHFEHTVAVTKRGCEILTK